MSDNLVKLYNYLDQNKITTSTQKEVYEFIQNGHISEAIDELIDGSIDDLKYNLRKYIFPKKNYTIRIDGIGMLKNSEVRINDISILTGKNSIGKLFS